MAWAVGKCWASAAAGSGAGCGMKWGPHPNAALGSSEGQSSLSGSWGKGLFNAI